MSGVSAVLAGASTSAALVTVGTFFLRAYRLFDYGYGSVFNPSVGGSIQNGTFKGATITDVYSFSDTVGVAQEYYVILSGNRAAGFLNTLTINGTTVVGSLSTPSYNSSTNTTMFVLTPSTITTTLFGTTAGAVVPVVLG